MARRLLVGAAAHGVADGVLPALRRAQARGDGALIRAGLVAAVAAALRRQVAGGAGLGRPDLLGVVLATRATGFVGLQLGDAAQARTDGLADGGGVVPAVDDLVGPLGRVLAALAGVVAGRVRGELP